MEQQRRERRRRNQFEGNIMVIVFKVAANGYGQPPRLQIFAFFHLHSAYVVYKPSSIPTAGGGLVAGVRRNGQQKSIFQIASFAPTFSFHSGLLFSLSCCCFFFWGFKVAHNKFCLSLWRGWFIRISCDCFPSSVPFSFPLGRFRPFTTFASISTLICHI